MGRHLSGGGDDGGVWVLSQFKVRNRHATLLMFKIVSFSLRSLSYLQPLPSHPTTTRTTAIKDEQPQGAKEVCFLS